MMAVRLVAIAVGAAAVAPLFAADYVVIRREVEVARPVDRVWARIGGYCAIGEWLKVKCEVIAGDGDVGSVRRLNDTVLEPMVAKTAHSYTYWQSEGAMGVAQFHGTLLAEPIGHGHTRLSYTIFYDAARLASDAVRASERKRLDTRFVEPLNEMKRLSEAR